MVRAECNPNGMVRAECNPNVEEQLTRQYLAKNKRYRRKQSPFPMQARAVFSTYYNLPNRVWTAEANAAAFWGNYLSSLDIAEPFRDSLAFRNISPVHQYQWAFLDTSGMPPIGETLYNLFPGLSFTTEMLRDYSEPPIAFWAINASYMADFNFGVNNFARSILAKPDYGIVVIPSSSGYLSDDVDLDAMAKGEAVGTAFVKSINRPNSSRRRWLTVLGDPTLRLNTLYPPVITTARVRSASPNNLVDLSWSPGEAAKYYVYRSGSPDGPFEQVGSAVTSTQMLDILDDAAKRYYIVRGAQLALTGRGSYWNLSQGSLAQAQF